MTEYVEDSLYIGIGRPSEELLSTGKIKSWLYLATDKGGDSMSEGKKKEEIFNFYICDLYYIL